MTSGKEVVLVTGGDGFLGQHVVKLLHLQAEWVNEIRIFDIKPFKNQLDYTEKKLCTSVVGDIRNVSDVVRAMHGVTTVIHVASVVDFTMFPDQHLMTSVNVEGTRNVIDACLACDVYQLVYTSSVDVMRSDHEIILGDESYPVPAPSKMRGAAEYSHTKLQAETLVNQAHNVTTVNGGNLKTISLRPHTLYGECDQVSYVAIAIKQGSKRIWWFSGVEFQFNYVGNVAWAHVEAAKGLFSNPEAGGQSYFISDNIPLKTPRDFAEPFIARRGLRFAPFPLSPWLLFLVLWIIKLLLMPVRLISKQVNFFIGPDCLSYFRTINSFSGKKLQKVLNYEPLYSVDEAFKNSAKYYDCFTGN